MTGRLMDSARGLVLEVDDGGLWALDAAPSARKLLGLRVTVEGTRSGFDRLDVDWIGQIGGSPIDQIRPDVAHT